MPCCFVPAWAEPERYALRLGFVHGFLAAGFVSRPWRQDRHIPGSRQHLAQRPLDAIHCLLYHLNLFGLLGVWRIRNGLQRIAHVVVHGGNHGYFPVYFFGPALFVGKNHQSRQHCDHQVIDITSCSRNTLPVQHSLHRRAQRKQPKAQQEAEPDPAEQSWNSGISRHSRAIHASYFLRVFRCFQGENKMIHPAKFMVAVILLCGVATHSVRAQSSGASAVPQYEVFAIRYASIPDFPVNALVAGTDPSRKLSIAMTVWLIRGHGRTILVDSGFYRPQFFKDFKVDGFLKPSEAVAQSGITPAVKPEEITDVIITHMHWDHADGMDLFPHALIWLQKDEYTYYTGEAWQQPRTHGGIDPDDVLEAVKLNLAGRVRLVNGDAQEIFPGITCYTGGKHTFQSQYVGVSTRAGTVILASDNMYLYENLEKHVPIAQTLDKDSNLRAQDRMKQLAASPRLIVPGHDPAVFEKFPKVSDRAVRIE